MINKLSLDFSFLFFFNRIEGLGCKRGTGIMEGKAFFKSSERPQLLDDFKATNLDIPWEVKCSFLLINKKASLKRLKSQNFLVIKG